MTHIQCVNGHLNFTTSISLFRLKLQRYIEHTIQFVCLCWKLKISNGVVKIVLYYTMFHFLWWRMCAKGSTIVMVLTINRSLKTNIWNSAWVGIVFNGKQWSNWGRTFLTFLWWRDFQNRVCWLILSMCMVCSNRQLALYVTFQHRSVGLFVW